MLSDKYKPKCVSDVILEENIRLKLQRFISTSNLPNLIITGTSGCGKSVLADCIARDMYKEDLKYYVCKLNSSLEKTIKLLQESFEQFCRKIIIPTKKNHTNKRMFIIDDIDNIPRKIQIIIASFMEKYPNIHFIMTCTETTDIIDVLQSHCLIMHIRKPPMKKIIDHLEMICNKEKCKYANDALERICFLSQSDVRVAINYLNTIMISYSNVSMSNIAKLCDTPSIETIKQIIQCIIDNENADALKISTKLFLDGYSGIDILSCMYEIITLPSYNMSEHKKIVFVSIIGKTLYHMNKRIDSIMQLERCIIKLCCCNFN